MKKSDIYQIVDRKIKIMSNHALIDPKDIKSIELKTNVVHKTMTGEVLNSIANAMSGSIANGNELVKVEIMIACDDQTYTLSLSEEPVVRNNLEYHDLVKRTRKLKDLLLEDIHKNHLIFKKI